MRKYLLFLFLLVVCLVQLPAQTQPNLSAQILHENPQVWLNFNDASGGLKDRITGNTWTPGPTTTVATDIPTPDHWWPLNGNGADIGSGTPDKLTVNGGILWMFSGGGVTGLPARMDNSGKYLQATSTATAAYAANQPITVSAWVYPNSWTGNWRPIITFGSVEYELVVSPDGQPCAFLYSTSGGGISQCATTGLTGGGIHHLVFTTDGSKTAAGTHVYVDGALVASSGSDGFAGGEFTAPTAPLLIGSKPGASQFIDGIIGDIRIWNVALTGTQVSHLYAQGWDGPYTATYQVPGFDPERVSNTAVRVNATSFDDPSGGSEAPYDATQPMAIYAHIDHLPVSGGIIASKDDSWILYFNGDDFCFQSQKVGRGVEGRCTAFTLWPGYKYDVVVNYVPGNADYHDNYQIAVNGISPPLYNATEYPDWTLGGGGSSLHIGSCCLGTGGGLHNMEIDELAIFNHTLDTNFIQSIFVHTKFYTDILGPRPANPPPMIVSEDGCTDPDNIAALNLAIKAHKLGYVKIRAVIDNDMMPNAHIFFRQILDSNGLAHIPLLVPDALADAYPPTVGSWSFTSNPAGDLSTGGQCSAPQLGAWLPTQWMNDYNASTPRSYHGVTQGVRKIIAGLPAGEKLAWLSGGGTVELQNFMQSPADSISSETGMQMWADHFLYVNFQGTGNLFNDGAASNWILANNGTVPLYFFDNGDFHTCCTPDQTGPGFNHTRLSADPLRLVTAAGWLGETRDGWDSLPTINFMTGVFRGTCTNETISILTDGSYTVNHSGTPSNHWACPLTPMAGNSSLNHGNSPFTWFVNSLGNSIAQGRPRGAD